jgi:hypothetical protein
MRRLCRVGGSKESVGPPAFLHLAAHVLLGSDPMVNLRRLLLKRHANSRPSLFLSLFFLETNRLLHVKKKRGFYMNRNAGDEQYDELGMDFHSGMNILLTAYKNQRCVPCSRHPCLLIRTAD